MVVDEKENLHPNSSQQNELTHIDTNVIKPLESLIDHQSAAAASLVVGAQRPLLFSEIVFSDVNGKQFGISCTNSAENSTNTLRYFRFNNKFALYP